MGTVYELCSANPRHDLCSMLTSSSPVHRAAPSADKRSFIDGVVNSAAQAAEAGSIKGLYAAVRQLERKPQRATDDPA